MICILFCSHYYFHSTERFMFQACLCQTVLLEFILPCGFNVAHVPEVGFHLEHKVTFWSMSWIVIFTLLCFHGSSHLIEIVLVRCTFEIFMLGVYLCPLGVPWPVRKSSLVKDHNILLSFLPRLSKWFKIIFVFIFGNLFFLLDGGQLL